jgi:MarR family transcriptional regulator, organic hydroperoxide resistance regulator
VIETDLSFSYEHPKLSPGYGLWLVSNRWQRLISQALAPLGLTHLQFVLLASLAWLSKLEEPITQVVLARHAGAEPMTVSNALKLLIKKGWVHRQAHASDTRAKVLALTATGRELAATAVARVEAVDRAFFTVLGPTGEQSLIDAFAQLRS